MIKRLLMLFFVIFFLVISPFFTYADVLYIPDNDFYQRYVDKCVFLGRSFCLGDGCESLPIKEEPGSKKEIGVINSGETVYIEYSCLYKGEYFGLVSFFNSEYQYISGWVEIKSLLVLYDYVAFEEEHQKEFYQYTGELVQLKEAKGAVIYGWPGSGAPIWTVEDLDTENFYIVHAYMDDEGREWGFVPYLYGSRDIWICLSDPLNEKLPAFNKDPSPTIWESETEHFDIFEGTKGGKNQVLLILLISILVIFLVVITVVLIKVLWNPKKG